MKVHRCGATQPGCTPALRASRLGVSYKDVPFGSDVAVPIPAVLTPLFLSAHTPMSEHGLTGFDRTLNETNVWLAEIADELGRPDRQVAYHALRGVLHALRDRLPVGEAFDLAAQLPMLVRGFYFEGYRPGGKPGKLDRDAFLCRVRDALQPAGGANAQAAALAVFVVLGRHVSAGEIAQVRAALPRDLRALWPEPERAAS